MDKQIRTNTAPEKLWNFNYIYFLFLSAFTAIAFNMITPVLPKFAISLGANLTIAGTISGLFSITALVIRPFSGAAVDRFNKKWMMISATAIIGLSVLCYSFSSSIPMLFLVRIIHGTAFAISGTTNIAFASSFIPRNRLGEGIGYLGLGQIIATAVGPNAGLWIMQNVGFSHCFIAAGVMSLISASLMFLIRHQHTKPRNTESKDRKRLCFKDLLAIELLPYAAFAMLFSLANGLVSAFIALLGEERGIANVGLFFTANAIFLLIVRPFAGKLNDKKGISFVLIPGYLLAAAAMAMLAGAGSIWLIILAGIFKAIGQGGAQPALQAECIRKLGRERSGVATSTYFIGADVGQGLGPIVGGAVSASFGYGTMYAGASVLLLCGLLMFLWYSRMQKSKLPDTNV